MKLKKHLKRILSVTLAAIIAIGAYFVYPIINKTVDYEYSLSAKNGKEIYLAAHRGLSSIAPENTKEAIVKAGEAGYYAAEFDIKLTKDGKWILMHDKTVDRMTDGEGEVTEFTFEEIQKLKINSGNGIKNYPYGIGISTFEEALETCDAYNMRAMIEIKGGTAEDMAGVLEIIESMNLKTKPLIIDFNSERIAALRKLNSEIEIWYLTKKISDETIEFAKEHGTALAFNHKKLANYKMLGKAQEEGVMLAAWTVDLLPAADILLSLGVNRITTNRILP